MFLVRDASVGKDASLHRGAPQARVPPGYNGMTSRALAEDGRNGHIPPQPRSIADRLVNLSRAEVMRIIEDRPGLSIQELAETLGLSRGAVRHHLVHLTRERYVSSHRHGSHVLLFSAIVPVLRRKAIFQLRIGSIRSIVEATIERPWFRPAEVADGAGISVRSVRRGLRVLERAGLVQSQSVKRGIYNLTFHPEMRIAWVLYGKDVAQAVTTLRRAPGWFIGFELLLGKLALGSWASS